MFFQKLVSCIIESKMVFLKIIPLLHLSLIFSCACSDNNAPVFFKNGVKIEVLQFNRSSHFEYSKSVEKTRGVCGSTYPYPKRICMSNILENARSTYHPCCIILHRCNVHECTGPKRNKIFLIHKENITFTVREKSLMNILPRYLRLTFENHTICEYV